MSYNGWKNYETWNIALWIDNDHGSYLQAREMAQEVFNEEDGTAEARKESGTRTLASNLKDWIEEQNPLASDSSMWSDLVSAALSEVDWYEIAEHYLSDVDTGECDCDEEDEEKESE